MPVKKPTDQGSKEAVAMDYLIEQHRFHQLGINKAKDFATDTVRLLVVYWTSVIFLAYSTTWEELYLSIFVAVVMLLLVPFKILYHRLEKRKLDRLQIQSKGDSDFWAHFG